MPAVYSKEVTEAMVKYKMTAYSIGVFLNSLNSTVNDSTDPPIYKFGTPNSLLEGDIQYLAKQFSRGIIFVLSNPEEDDWNHICHTYIEEDIILRALKLRAFL